MQFEYIENRDVENTFFLWLKKWGSKKSNHFQRYCCLFSHSPSIRELIEEAHSWYEKLLISKIVILCCVCKISEMMTIVKMSFLLNEVKFQRILTVLGIPRETNFSNSSRESLLKRWSICGERGELCTIRTENNFKMPLGIAVVQMSPVPHFRGSSTGPLPYHPLSHTKAQVHLLQPPIPFSDPVTSSLTFHLWNQTPNTLISHEEQCNQLLLLSFSSCRHFAPTQITSRSFPKWRLFLPKRNSVLGLRSPGWPAGGWRRAEKL